MKTITGVVDKEIVVMNDTDLAGMARATVRVEAPVLLRVSGSLIGDAVLHSGARLAVTGCLNGDVFAPRDALVDVSGLHVGSVQRSD